VCCSLEDEVHASRHAESWLEKMMWLLISPSSLSPLHDHITSFHFSNFRLKVYHFSTASILGYSDLHGSQTECWRGVVGGLDTPPTAGMPYSWAQTHMKYEGLHFRLNYQHSMCIRKFWGTRWLLMFSSIIHSPILAGDFCRCLYQPSTQSLTISYTLYVKRVEFDVLKLSFCSTYKI
jgi:hypothetical protein